jgi:RNA polymerase sigma factor (sigma-70 family)
MNTSLYEKICRYQDGDSSAAMELLEAFTPLLNKYARLSHAEDAREELQCHLLEVCKQVNLNMRNDGAVVNYIKFAVRNHSILLSKRKYKNSNTIFVNDLSDAANVQLEIQESTLDSYDCLLWDEVKTFLTEKEYKIVYALYAQQHSVSEIAIQIGVSRQAVNQLKNTALKKLKRLWNE